MQNKSIMPQLLQQKAKTLSKMLRVVKTRMNRNKKKFLKKMKLKRKIHFNLTLSLMTLLKSSKSSTRREKKDLTTKSSLVIHL